MNDLLHMQSFYTIKIEICCNSVLIIIYSIDISDDNSRTTHFNLLGWLETICCLRFWIEI